jgi:hypothetical protein
MKLVAAVCLLAAGASVNACGAASERWSERVQLSDGRVIVVERETLNEPGGDEWAFNRAGVKPREYRIRFVWPEGTGQMIEWKSIKKSPQTWPESPLIFDIEAGHPVVYTIVHVDPACEIYLKYRYEDSAWKEQRLPDRFEQRATKLLIRDGIDMPKFVTLQEKRTSNAEAGYRETLRQVGPDRQVCG